MASVTLSALGPLEQLRAGRLGRRVPQLLIGLTLYGISLGLFIRAALGVSPWDVLTQGIQRFVPLSFGTITIIMSVLVLLLWIPLRQMPGLGTLCNVVVIGVAADATLGLLPVQDELWIRIPLLIAGVLVNGLAGAIYIGAQLGPGARDGLMTGLHRRTGLSLRVVRIGIEVTVAGIGFALGGQLGIGTLVYALCIGPVVQFFLPYVFVELPEEEPTRRAGTSTGA